MNRRVFLKKCALSVAIGSGVMAGRISRGGEGPKPNFVVIFADDMGYGDAGCYGNPTIKTPNLDRMAAEGMKLPQFYSASSVCSPSRASLLTGRLPKRCGVTGVLWPHTQKGLLAGEVTVADLLKRNGYTTTCIGKWHLGHRQGYLPISRGFDSYYGVPYSNDMWIDPNMKLAKDIKLREGVTVREIRADKYKKHRPHYVPLMRDDEVIEFPADQATLTRRYTERAIAFIKENRNRPFFLYLPHTFPHIPLFASESFQDTSRRGLYGDVIEELDWSVGEVLGTLKEMGLDKNTLVLFTSDNGPWLSVKLAGGSAGLLRGGKFTTWDGGHREPALAWWPGTVPAGTVNMTLASTLDVMPTCLDLAGVKLPTDRAIDGYSLKDALTQGAESPRQTMFYYSGPKLRAVRWKQWKLHLDEPRSELGGGYKQSDKRLLFNLEHDPGEKYNVADRNPEIVETIRRVIEKHLATMK